MGFSRKSDEKTGTASERERKDAIVREMDKLVDRMKQVTEKLETKLQTEG